MDPRGALEASAAHEGQESLNEALDDLEQMLEGQRRGVVRPGGSGAPASAREHAIPLLDDVVAPGQEDDQAPGPRHAPDSIESDEDCQVVIRRLASEIEVIVQAGVEEALREANQRIAERVKRHIDITLPEILDEIAEIKAHKGF